MPTLTTTKRLKVTELDFDLIKTSLKDYLKAQDQFTDYDFEGSAMSILLDTLAYNTHYNAYYTNMISNEMFLDTATLRDSVVSLANQLGYTPSSVSGARATVTMTFSPNDLGGYDKGQATPSSRLGTNVVVPKGSVFTSELNSKTYSFVTIKSHTASPTANSDGGFLIDDTPTSEVVPYIISDIEIVQGVYASIQYVYNEQMKQDFIIPNAGVDISTATVVVTDAIGGTSGTVYTLAEDYTLLDSDSNVFFVQEVRNGKYEIYFGDGTIGASPADGNIIDITYVVSEGDVGNGATIFESDPIKSPFYGINASTRTYAPAVVTTINAAGGGPRESIDSIKFLAPRNFESQNRAVTAEDYVVKLKSAYKQLDAVHAWGGEENTPPDYGKVYISIKPKSGYVITATEKEKIKREILKSRNVLTVEPVLVDPEFIYLVIDAGVKWDSRLTTLTGSTLKVGILDEIIRWGQDNLEQFDTYFRYSNLLRAIGDFNSGVVNTTMAIKLRALVSPAINEARTYTINFANPIYHPHAAHQGSVTSTSFDYSGFTSCNLLDNNGILEIYGHSSSGQNVLVSANAGTVDYKNGTINIVEFQPTNVVGGILSITVVPLDQDIVPDNNQLITIVDSDIILNMFDDASQLTGTIGTTRARVGLSN